MQNLMIDYQISIEQLVNSVVTMTVTMFKERVLSIYLSGSLSRSQMTLSSDIDLIVVFRGSVPPEEEKHFMEFRSILQTLSPLRLDMWVEPEDKMKERPASASMRASQCLYGQPFLKDVPLQTIEAYSMRSIHKAIHYMTVLRGRPQINPSPLDYPDSQDIYFGYTKQGGFADAESFQQGTRIIVDMITRCTTAIIAIELGIESDTKQDSVDTYASKIDGKWGGFIKEVYHFIKHDLQYCLPESDESQKRFIALCGQLLDFENDTLMQFKPIIIQCLASSDRRQRKLALVALKNIQVHDETIINLLAISDSDDKGLLDLVKSLHNVS